MDHEFEDVEIKINAPKLLEQKLKNKRKKCMIGTGAMSDPYIPIIENLHNIRVCLEIIEKYGFGLAIQTKSNLILRDIDLLALPAKWWKVPCSNFPNETGGRPKSIPVPETTGHAFNPLYATVYRLCHPVCYP
jgi:hypothetical protein